ncbi:MAG: DUF5107 domain-containing protein [Ginsengibacter sp.]
MKRSLYAIGFILNFCATSAAQQKATVREYSKTFTTYPFSDPDPIPQFGKIYPYFRFDGYTDKPIQKDWKVVELENDYIRVMILPQIGGKIWTAIEKSTGEPFIYYNHVIKFRDVALRGAWTNGGIEANYGIIGHTPNVATPVDYTIIHKSNGSVSCVIGVLDLLTRTTWRLDINLEKDRAYFTTSSFWYNASAVEQPYYNWMNAGIKSSGNLQFINPGTKYLSHEGEYKKWPVSEDGTDLSFYDNNDFGGYKSYHVFGKYSNFYGGFWHDEDFGMGHFATYDDKAGKKIWLWGLSGQGMTWEKLLTDTDGQEVEVQSGRLFNQPQGTSSFTPFKNKGFLPHTTDTWTEYWFPAVKTRGIVIGNNYGVLNIKKDNGWFIIYFSPLQATNDELHITAGNKNIYSKKLTLQPLQLFVDSFQFNNTSGDYIVTLGAHKLDYESAPTANEIGRPAETPVDFDRNSSFGLYMQGKEEIHKRYYVLAEKKLRECLAKEPYFTPALVDLSMILYNNRQYHEALEMAKKALSVNTYDPAANYYYGLINNKLGNTVDAKEGLDWASTGMEYRSAAYTMLANIYCKEGNISRCIEYSQKSIDFNKYAVDAYQLLAVCYRLLQNKQEAGKALDTLLAYDPLNHFAQYEKYLWSGRDAEKDHFTGMIRNEMPHETFLELAIWYNTIGRTEEADNVLKLAPQHTEVLYWQAFLENKLLDTSKLDPQLVFPFRPETADILETLIEKNDHWLLKYHLSLIEWYMNHMQRVKELFAQIGNQPGYAPYYATRASLYKNDSLYTALNLADLVHAAEIDPKQWRFGANLVEWYIARHEPQKALPVAAKYYLQDPANYHIGMLYGKSLIMNHDYAAAWKIMKKLVILPNEGSTNGRDIYKEAVMMLAVEQMRKENYSKAVSYVTDARKWPANLGVGKPYESDIDERLEDWLAYECFFRLGNTMAAKQMLDKILLFDRDKNAYGRHISTVNHLVTLWALRKNGKEKDAENILQSLSENDPGNTILQWVDATFHGKDAALPDDKAYDENYRIIRSLPAFSKQ